MSFMKRVIVSLIICFSLLFFCSCEKKESFIIQYNNNIVNDNIILTIYTKEKESVYLDKNNIQLALIQDLKDEINIIVDVKKVEYLSKNNEFYIYEIELDISNIKNDFVVIDEGYIVIKYINEKILKLDIEDFCFYNVNSSNEIEFKNIKANIKGGLLESINFDLKNSTNEIIEILDILLINAKFEPYFIDLDKTNKIIDKNTTISYYIRIKEYKNVEVVDSAFLIKYIHQGNIKYRVVSNYIFIKNKSDIEKVYYVTN